MYVCVDTKMAHHTAYKHATICVTSCMCACCRQDFPPQPVSARYKEANDLSLQASFTDAANAAAANRPIDAARIAEYKAKMAQAADVTLSVKTTTPEVTPRSDADSNQTVFLVNN